MQRQEIKGKRPMLATVVLGIFALLLAGILVRSLLTGRIEFGSGPSGLVATRRDQPASYWTIFAIGASIVAIFVWLLVAA